MVKNVNISNKKKLRHGIEKKLNSFSTKNKMQKKTLKYRKIFKYWLYIRNLSVLQLKTLQTFEWLIKNVYLIIAYYIND
jgi:hypothetical protein